MIKLAVIKLAVKKLTVAALVFGAASIAWGQEGTRRMDSPEILPGHRVTFRVSAPKATEVILRFGDGGPRTHTMTKGENGVWSVTIGPMEPEIYNYSFLIDGVKTLDLANPILKVGATVDACVAPGSAVAPEIPAAAGIDNYRSQRGLFRWIPSS